MRPARPGCSVRGLRKAANTENRLPQTACPDFAIEIATELCYSSTMKEIIFEVIQEADGGFVAECLTESIFTQGDTWEGLRKQVRDAVEGYFFDQPKPKLIRLHFVRDEVLAPA